MPPEDRPAAAARTKALANLEAKANEADAKSRDRYWQNGPHNVQSWALRGFVTALSIVSKNKPNAGESADAYLARVAALVHAERDNGPSEDDEAWYSSAIDEAVSVIRSTS